MAITAVTNFLLQAACLKSTYQTFHVQYQKVYPISWFNSNHPIHLQLVYNQIILTDIPISLSVW